MRSHKGFMLALTAFATITTVSAAQSANPAPPDSSVMSTVPTQSQPAPIVRSQPTAPPDNATDQDQPAVTTYTHNTYIAKVKAGQVIAPKQGVASALPAPGVYLRVGEDSSVRAVTVTNQDIDLRVEHGIANVSVHNPVSHAQIIVDLPGGQADLLKDGFYTFNADTNTVRVLKGEALAYPGTSTTNEKPIKIKENHAVDFSGPNFRPFEFDPAEGSADLIPYTPRAGGNYDAEDGRYYGGAPYSGYPYYGYGSPYYYGYPWAFDPWGFNMGFWGGWGWGLGWGGGYGGWRGGYGGWRGGDGGWHGGGGGHGGFGGGGHGGGGGHAGGGGGGHH
jgi:hypothetical protein